jgi:hypothetical protein
MEIRPARDADAWALWKAEVATAEVPGQLVSRPEELSAVSFETKIRRDRVRLPNGEFVDDLAMAWFPTGPSGQGPAVGR